MASRKYILISPPRPRQEVSVDVDQTVEEVRGLFLAILDVDEAHEVIITYLGKRVLDNMGVWKDAMDAICPQANPNIVEKLYCSVTTKAEVLEPSSAALRAALPNGAMSHVEREQMLATYGPMIDMMAGNPEMLSSIMRSQGINPDHPQAKQMIRDKDFMKKVLLSSVDPDAQRSLQQEMNLQVAQLGALPEGSFYVNSMMEHAARGEDSLFLDSQKSDIDLNPATEEHSRPIPTQEANTEVLPNPWDNDTPPSNPMMSSPFGSRGMMPGWNYNPLMGNGIWPGMNGSQSLFGGGMTGTSAQVVTSNSTSGSLAPVIPGRPKDPSVLRNLYNEQLHQLQSLGFEDDNLSLEALAASNGDIGNALDYIEAKQR